MNHSYEPCSPTGCTVCSVVTCAVVVDGNCVVNFDTTPSLAQAREQRRALGEALDERPAERIDEHRDDARRALVELPAGRRRAAPPRSRSPNSCSSVPGMRAKP